MQKSKQYSAPVMITGGAGYIGSHVVYALKQHNIPLVIVDNFSTSTPPSDDSQTIFKGDFGDTQAIKKLIKEHKIKTIFHFAGSTVVPESIELPIKYYQNNVAKLLNFLEACENSSVEQFIFSSTAAVYGSPQSSTVEENHPTQPLSPYGHSKLMGEQILQDFEKASGIKYGILRYFNVAGFDPNSLFTRKKMHATHLIKVACEVATAKRDKINIFGTDYNTPDGSCIRDFIHVSDLADIHVLLLDYFSQGGNSQILNCGYGSGFSVREVIACVEELIQQALPYEEAERRPGDCAEVIADNSKIKQLLDWQPKHADLRTIIESSLAWERGL